jgi:methionyl-tRNA synthetase
VLYDLLETLRISAVLLSPALTGAPAEILRQIGFPEGLAGVGLPAAAAFGLLPPGRRVRRGASLFPRIEPDKEPEEGAALVPGHPPASAGRPAAGHTEGPKPAPAGPAVSAQPGLISLDEFQRADLRVARVIEAAAVPNTTKLLRLRIEIAGDERQIIAGVAGHYAPEQVAGKNIVVVANLQPARIKGEHSNGMLLAAVEGDTLALVVPERDVPSGAKVR